MSVQLNHVYRGTALLAVLATAAALAAGCSDSSDQSKVATVIPSAPPVPASAAATDATSTAELPAISELVPAGPRHVAALAADGRSAILLDARGKDTATIDFDAPVQAIGTGPNGRGIIAAAATPDGVEVGWYDEAGQRLGTFTTTPVTGEGVGGAGGRGGAIAVLADGTIALGYASELRTYSADGTKIDSVDGFVTVDAIVQPVDADGVGERLLVLDRAQSMVQSVKTDGLTTYPGLRAGSGAAKIAVDDKGRAVVTNAAEGEILGYTAEPFVNRFNYPVSGSTAFPAPADTGPWAVTFDQAGIAWVTVPSANEVRGYDLGTGMPVLTQTIATIAQPTGLSMVGPGTLLVTSGSGAGAQILSIDE